MVYVFSKFWIRPAVASTLVLASTLLCSVPNSESLAAESAPITDARALWQGIDPAALPLEVESLSQWTADGAEFEKLRFTSEIVDGVPARVFAIRGAPAARDGAAGKVPGILHIHGGGQTASLDWVKFWVSRGYTCVTFDFCGPWADRKEVTDWGPLKHANMAQAAGGFQVHPTPRESSWFHWALASRRALNVLAGDPRTDADRLGIFGISMGGTLCWLVAASDDRVKTAVPIYGCGYNFDDRRERFGLGKLTDDLRLYKQTLAPEAHAALVNIPVLFLNSTNDFHGPLDFAFDTLGAVKGPTRWAFTPRYNHHIAAREAKDLPLWMDWQLRGGTAWPATPKLTLAIDESGNPRATVSPDRPEEVAAVELLYSLGDRLPAARYWREAAVQQAGAHWQAATPVMNVDEPLWVLANVTYRSGVTLSSNMPMLLPREIPAISSTTARATLTWSPQLADGRDGVSNWFFTAGSTDPTREINYLAAASEDGQSYLTHDSQLLPNGGPIQFSSHIIGDPQHIGQPGDTLSFEARGDFGEKGLTVNVFEHDWAPRSKKFSVTVLAAGEAASADNKPAASPGESATWRTVTVTPEQFRAEDAAALGSWTAVQRLELTGHSQGKSGFRNFRWAPAK